MPPIFYQAAEEIQSNSSHKQRNEIKSFCLSSIIFVCWFFFSPFPESQLFMQIHYDAFCLYLIYGTSWLQNLVYHTFSANTLPGDLLWFNFVTFLYLSTCVMISFGMIGMQLEREKCSGQSNLSLCAPSSGVYKCSHCFVYRALSVYYQMHFSVKLQIIY